MRRSIRRGLISAAVLLLAGLFVAPHLIDREALRTALIEQLSIALGRPVDIGVLDVRLLPQPTVTLERASVRFSEHPLDILDIGRISAKLDARSLLTRQIRFTGIEIDTLALNSRLVKTLRNTAAALGQGASGSSVDVRLQKARIDGLSWTTADGLELGPYTATATWQDAALPQLVVIAQEDSRLQIQLGFSGTAIDVEAIAHEWTPPARAPLQKPLHITDMRAQARYTENKLEIIDAELTGVFGQLQLNGRLDWREAWIFDGKLAGADIDLPQLLGSFGLSSIPGQTRGECLLKLHGENAEQLFRQPGLDCTLYHAHAGRDAQLRILTRPEADALSYRVDARNLTLPVGPALHFDELDLSGNLARGQITFKTAHASAYRGDVKMQGELSWRTGWQWNFVANSRKLRLDPLLAVFDQHNLDGNLDADCQGRLAGKTFAALFGQPGLNCDFALTEGVLRNTDLEQAARLIKLDSKTDGDTPFDHLSGHLLMREGQAQFTGLKLRSTALEAKGDVSIDREKKLSGELSAGVKNTGGMMSVPLAVSGTVGDPVIRPTTSAMAGGAAGTMLLGPGVGTAVGVKVGEAFSKMTGWLKPKSKDEAAQD